MKPERHVVAEQETDLELVRASLAGDREAFGRIVERHQTAVCAVTYAVAGKLQLGQDLAQETFLEAWRSLGSLRDAGRLRAWLCGIARNVAHDALRRRGVEAAPADGADASDERTPEASALAGEEARIVARALADMPADYREPLILFYWQDQSVRRVAETLALSEDAVKQRLSRGRKLVRRELEAMVADGLLRLRPGRAFTAAVLAALPLGPREAAAAGAATMAHSAAAKVVGGLGVAGAGALAGALVGVGGALIGARASIANTRSPRERRFMVRMAWMAAALSAAMVALQGAVAVVSPALFGSIAWHVAVAAVETAVIVWLIVRGNQRQRQIQQEDGTPPPPPPPGGRAAAAGFAIVCLAYVALALAVQHFLESRFPEFAASVSGQLTFAALYGVGLLQLIVRAGGRSGATIEPSAEAPQWTPTAVRQSLGGGVFGSVCWMFPMCVIAGDWVTAAVVLAAALLAFRWGVTATLRAPDRYFRVAQRVFAALTGLTLVVVNLRWEAWMVAYRQSALYDTSADLPLWAMNLLVVAVSAWTARALARRERGG